jgi:hypothetical protein
MGWRERDRKSRIEVKSEMEIYRVGDRMRKREI